MKKLIALMLLLGWGAAWAIPVQWTIHDLIFADGSEMTGSFVFDADLMNNASYTQYGEDEPTYYTAGYSESYFEYEPFPEDPNPWGGYSIEYVNCYESPACFTTGTGNDAIYLNYTVFPLPHWEWPDVDIVLIFDELTNAGGYRELRVYGETLQSGYLMGTVVPIPAAVWLFGSALAALGWLRR